MLVCLHQLDPARYPVDAQVSAPRHGTNLGLVTDHGPDLTLGDECVLIINSECDTRSGYLFVLISSSFSLSDSVPDSTSLATVIC